MNKGLKEAIGAREKVERLQNRLPFKHDILVGWKHLDYPKIKINTDGTTKGNPKLASAGCVLQDAQGKWIIGAARNLDITTLVTAELWAIYQGLYLAWEREFMNVVLETDSQVALHLVMGSRVTTGYNGILVDKYKRFLQRD